MEMELQPQERISKPSHCNTWDFSWPVGRKAILQCVFTGQKPWLDNTMTRQIFTLSPTASRNQKCYFSTPFPQKITLPLSFISVIIYGISTHGKLSTRTVARKHKLWIKFRQVYCGYTKNKLWLNYCRRNDLLSFQSREWFTYQLIHIVFLAP